jgi:hypothetical protein
MRAGLALSLLLLLPEANETARPTPPRTGLSWQEADELQRTLDRLERRHRAGRPASRETVVVTERQLDSYLNLTLAPQIPPGVRDVDVGLDRDTVSARAVVDLERMRETIGAGGVLGLLSGSVPVELRGRFTGEAGQGRLEIDDARLAGVRLPSSVLAQLVAHATRTASRPDGVDILAPFALPWGARRVRLEPGRALLDFQFE